jgi:hypothetical protein
MYTKPSILHLLQTVQSALEQDIAKELSSSQAKTALAMVQALLQWVVQRVQNDTPALTAEHNEMITLHHMLAAQIAGCSGEAAARIEQRGATLGKREPIPAPYPFERLADAHHELSEGLISTLSDLDELLRAGESRAQSALETLRRHMVRRAMLEHQTQTVQRTPYAGRE